MTKQIKLDCMFCSEGICMALITRDCNNCNFFLTKEQRENKRQKAFKRIFKLPLREQEHIAVTYYSGAMPWRI